MLAKSALSLALLDPSGAAAFGPPDWSSLGLVLSIVGCLLLANVLLFRNPRALVADRLGRPTQDLRRIREFVFQRVQMTLGFMFLVSGFAAQLYGRSIPQTEATGSAALWLGGVVLLAVGLEFGGWWWSLRSLRRYVREHLREHPPDFETDTNLAREVGELFGLDSTQDETVQSYASRLRSELGLTAPRNAGRVRPQHPQPDARRSPVDEFDFGAEEF